MKEYQFAPRIVIPWGKLMEGNLVIFNPESLKLGIGFIPVFATIKDAENFLSTYNLQSDMMTIPLVMEKKENTDRKKRKTTRKKSQKPA
jgi:hypothetical protein